MGPSALLLAFALAAAGSEDGYVVADPGELEGRYVRYPGLYTRLDALAWDAAAAEVRGAVQQELDVLGVRPAHEDWTLPLRIAQGSRHSGPWIVRWHLDAFEQAVEAGDPYIARDALAVMRLMGEPGPGNAEARIPARWCDPGMPGLLLAALVGPMVLAVTWDLGLLVRDMRWRRRRRRRGRLPNPYITGRPVRDPQLVFGREALLDDLVARFDNRRSCWVTGERRIGKTTVLLQLADQVRARGGTAVFVDIEGTRRDQARASVAKGLRDAGAVPAPTLAEMAKGLTASGSVALLIDEIDALNASDASVRAEIRALALGPDAPCVLLGAGVGLDLELDDEARLWAGELDSLEVAPLTPAACRALLLEPMAGTVRWTEDAVVDVLEAADGRPMRVQLFALKAVERAESRGARTIRARDVAAVRAAVETAWQAVQRREDIAADVLIDLDAAVLELGFRRLQVQALRRALETR